MQPSLRGLCAFVLASTLLFACSSGVARTTSAGGSTSASSGASSAFTPMVLDFLLAHPKP